MKTGVTHGENDVGATSTLTSVTATLPRQERSLLCGCFKTLKIKIQNIEHNRREFASKFIIYTEGMLLF
jgi:hypothetical protein